MHRTLGHARVEPVEQSGRPVIVRDRLGEDSAVAARSVEDGVAVVHAAGGMYVGVLRMQSLQHDELAIPVMVFRRRIGMHRMRDRFRQALAEHREGQLALAEDVDLEGGVVLRREDARILCRRLPAFHDVDGVLCDEVLTHPLPVRPHLVEETDLPKGPGA